jgi:hypothetical protein
MTMELTVSRWVDRPLPVATALPRRRIDLEPGRLTMAEGRRDGRSLRARGRFTFTGRALVPVARVEIELVPWSAGACEVLVRPMGRWAPSWGRARTRRFYALAHAAADHLAAELHRPLALDEVEREPVPLSVSRGARCHGIGDQRDPRRPTGRGGVVGAA